MRGVAVVSEVQFLSASNDMTIRRWLITGECLDTIHGHTNFIYSIALLADGEGFVSSGEDRTVRVWRGRECRQTITLPAQSVWSVCTLANGDIVAGSRYGKECVAVDVHMLFLRSCNIYLIMFVVISMV